jgi:zona occludens toxin (predicted ATPase)
MTTVFINTPHTAGVTFGTSQAAEFFMRMLSWFTVAKPARSRTLDEAGRIGEAARVRRLAQSVMADDPRFASDLFAAADRHEIG